MLVEAAKIAAKRFESALFEADALTLPLADESLDLITIAFGFRNLANYGDGLRELLRVLKPGGWLRSWNSRSRPIGPSARSMDSFRRACCHGSAA